MGIGGATWFFSNLKPNMTMQNQVSHMIAIVAALSLGSSGSWGQEGRQLSREELLAARAASEARQAKLKPSVPKENKSHPTQSGILDRSTIIVSERHWTCVPKGAVLYAAPEHKNRLGAESKGTYLDFNRFIERNRGWLVTYGVSLQQARGKSPISEDTRKSFATCGRTVISVFRGGPISTRPYQEEEVVVK
ncbi:hypothetical protein GCM10007100_26470 [Roseibacillus persicicus]|uniref:Uncharacterized protein n=2 Tax=Roseibacillus persicicus TaxID=454148 RepID=A0A918TQ27_9BACT|nr:hypothetical protein GCM10007100_26470 [Roseibacillus persicicus]